MKTSTQIHHLQSQTPVEAFQNGSASLSKSKSIGTVERGGMLHNTPSSSNGINTPSGANHSVPVVQLNGKPLPASLGTSSVNTPPPTPAAPATPTTHTPSPSKTPSTIAPGSSNSPSPDKNDDPTYLSSRKRPRTKEDSDIQLATRNRLAQLLAADHKAVLNPDVETPFKDTADVVRRLLPYHVFHIPSQDIRYAISRNSALATTTKGKEKATLLPPHLQALAEENAETQLALDLHLQTRALKEQFRRIRTREAQRTSPIDQLYWLTHAMLESDRTTNMQLSAQLREAQYAKDQRDKRTATAQPSTPVTAANVYQRTPYAYTYPTATATVPSTAAYPNYAAYTASPAYQAYYQQYAAAMNGVRLPYAATYPYGPYTPYIPVPTTPVTSALASGSTAAVAASPATTTIAASTAANTPVNTIAPTLPTAPPNSALPLSLPSSALEKLRFKKENMGEKDTPIDTTDQGGYGGSGDPFTRGHQAPSELGQFKAPKGVESVSNPQQLEGARDEEFERNAGEGIVSPNEQAAAQATSSGTGEEAIFANANRASGASG
ncbi:hypothetical protein FRB99_005073 [Tulasnella sp. 403]|nr:hypothetical protein FRB99_005073 [Tulasnella sp. 403]